MNFIKYIVQNRNQIFNLTLEHIELKFDLVTLKDDKNFFPPYYAIPIIRREVLEEYPEVESLINELGTYLNDEVMISLNYKVDELQQEPDQVAREFLIEKGLIK
ncbi:MAG: hypothetical protein GX288_11895 [Clostridiales bacterium]|nr:hypothetical protein [Clostridiales bacterium]